MHLDKGQLDQMKVGGDEYERERGELEGTARVWDLGSPLYDSFEIVSLSHLLDRKLMSFTGSASETELTLTGWFSFSHSQASSAPSSKLADPVLGHTKMALLSGLMRMRGFTRRNKRKVEGEMRRKEGLKKIKASLHVLSSSCGSFAFWRK
ncbi:hypothetical protein ACLOJK_014456 [Asimina triloba]